MKRDLFHQYNTDIKLVYEAYLSVLKVDPFRKNPAETPYSLLSFGIGLSYKYNMNGGSVLIHFSEKDGGTLVQVRFSIVQLFGARYKAYDKLLTDLVIKHLGPQVTIGPAIEKAVNDNEPEEIIEEKPVKEQIQETKVVEESTPKPRPKFCGKCGYPLEPNGNFCGRCGAKIEY